MQSKILYDLIIFLRGLKVMWRVQVAVLLRETKTRFGKNKLGYLWAFVEPSACCDPYIYTQ